MKTRYLYKQAFEFTRNFFFTGKTQRCYLSSNYNIDHHSYLFVSESREDINLKVTNPYIPLEELVQNIDQYRENMRNRKLKADVLETIGKNVEMLNNMKIQNNEFKKRYTFLQKHIKYTGKYDEQQIKNMIKEKDEIKISLNNLSREKSNLEDKIIPLILRLPNKLNPNTPTNDDLFLEQNISKKSLFNFKPKSHVELANINKTIEFSNISPNSYFLLGDLAIMELNIGNWFSKCFSNFLFMPISCPDFVTSSILEGIGGVPQDTSQTIIVNDTQNIETNYHLVGSSSLSSLCGYLTRVNTYFKSLPLRYFVFGRQYNAKVGNYLSLFNCVQSSCLSYIIASTQQESIDHFSEALNIVKTCYNEIGLPYRIRHINASKLNFTECEKIQFEIYSQHLCDFVPCGNITYYGDFLSKRMNMVFGNPYDHKGHLFITSGTAVNIPILIGCLMEHYQKKDGTFSIPDIFSL